MSAFEKKRKPEKPDNASAADASPAAANSGQADADSIRLEILPASAEINEAPDGWSNIESAPLNGARVMVSKTGQDRGVLVYWRVSTYVDKKALRYIPKGRWTDFLSRLDIDFEPNYWQAYDPEKYWPVRAESVQTV